MFFPLLLLGIFVFRLFLTFAFRSIGLSFGAESFRSKLLFCIALSLPLATLIALVLFGGSIADTGLGNRILHAVGGGATVVVLVESVLCRANKRPGLWGEWFLVLAAVSIAGVGNEILEFFLELSGHGTFAADIVDTWLDLVANTVGAFLSWPILAALTWKNRAAS